MSALSLAARQVQRQATLQPRLALPAGRTVSLEEGRRLAKLVTEEEDRLTSGATHLLEQAGDTPVILEEKVSRRILLLRQQQNTDANIKAAVAYAKRLKKNSLVSSQDSEKMRGVADKLLRGAEAPKGDVSRRQRRERATAKKTKAKKSRK